MTDIEYWDGELTKKLDELEEATKKLKSMFGGDKEEAAAKCEATLKRVREVKKGYNYEMRMSLKNDPRRFEYAEKLKQADERLAALETELKWVKSEADKKSLFKGAKEGTGGPLNERSTNDDYLKEARKLQDKTEVALQSALEMVEATKKVGADTVEELNRQKEQIAEITDTVTAMDDGLTRADKLIRAFGRRIATDKFIQLFFILNFGCLIGIIVWYALKKGKIKPPHINIPPMPNPFSAISGESDPAATTTTTTSTTDGASTSTDGSAGARAETVARYLRRGY